MLNHELTQRHLHRESEDTKQPGINNPKDPFQGKNDELLCLQKKNKLFCIDYKVLTEQSEKEYSKFCCVFDFNLLMFGRAKLWAKGRRGKEICLRISMLQPPPRLFVFEIFRAEIFFLVGQN